MPDSVDFGAGAASASGRPGQSALDAPIRVTVFGDYGASRKVENETTLREMLVPLRDIRAMSKDALPWLKMATFGNMVTKLGSLRHDANVTAIYGIEADYDGESITLDRARRIISTANLAAVLYTSPSHTPEAPRWRVLCPTSGPLPPGERAGLVARLNGLFVGGFSAESFTLSQAYYFGAVTGAVHHAVVALDGRFIDEAAELDADAVGRPAKPVQTAPAPSQGARGAVDASAWTEGSAYGRRALESECRAIRMAGEGGKHHALNKAAYSIGGLVGAGALPEGLAMGELTAALFDIRARCQDFRAAERTLRSSFEQGKAAPRQIPEATGGAERPAPFGLGAAGRAEPAHDPETGEVIEDAPGPSAQVMPGAPKGPKPLRILSLIEAEALPPPEWLVDGLVPAQGLVVPYGPPKIGKTFIVLSLALHIAAGAPWMGREVKQGAVVYIVGEGLGGFPLRTKAMRALYGFDADIPFFIIPRAVNFREDAAVAELAALVRQAVPAGMPIAMVVIDTLARAMPGVDENSAQEVGLVIARCDGLKEELGCAICPVHHTGKDVERGMRGTNAIAGAVDASFIVEAASEGHVRLINEFQKDGEPAKPMLFHLQEVSTGFRSSLVPVLVEEARGPGRPKNPDAPDAQEMLMRVILAMGGEKQLPFRRVAEALGVPPGRASNDLRDIIPVGRAQAARVDHGGGHTLLWRRIAGEHKTAPIFIHMEGSNDAQ